MLPRISAIRRPIPLNTYRNVRYNSQLPPPPPPSVVKRPKRDLPSLQEIAAMEKANRMTLNMKPPDVQEIPKRTGWARILDYNPWSQSFPGGFRMRAFVQAMVYAIALVAAAKRFDDTVFNSEEIRYGGPRQIRLAIASLEKEFPDKNDVVTDPDTLKTYGFSPHSYHPATSHSVVVRPHSTEDIVKIVKIANSFSIPIVVYSGATSLEGQYSGVSTGSICLDMSTMDKILEIHEADSDLVCQPGARWEDINQTLADKGIPLFFPLDPGPGATIGGMVGTGCSGTNAVRYGTAKAEWFLNLTVVLPNGEVIKTRQRARKSAAGFDTTKLFIGAEGTLGIITEATLRLTPKLPTKVAMAQFPNVEEAVDAVQEILNAPYGSHMQCIELLDDHMMDAINKAGLVDKPYPVENTLFFKVQGDGRAIETASRELETITKKHGSTYFKFTKTDEDAENLWQNRKYALMSTIAAFPGTHCWSTDVCVPVSKLPQLVYETKKDLQESGLTSTIAGHVGDGNFHSFILFRNDEELRKVHDAVHRLVLRAIAMEGTCTGEHGVGLGKKEFLVQELGEGTVELMRTIKNAVDPKHIMNPGKLYPEKSEKTNAK